MNSRWSVAMAAVAFCAAGFARPAQAQSVFHFVYAYDFDYSNNLPGQPVETSVTVNPGDWVRWIFLADLHDTVSNDGQAEFWQSELLFTGAEYEHQFTIPGTYWYYCSMHAEQNPDGTYTGMIGSVIVTPAPSAAAMIAGAGAFAALRRRRAA